MNPRILEIRRGVLEQNDLLAGGLRSQFHKAGVLVLNLVSSPGSGKTAFLEWTLRALIGRGFRAAALVGDLATENDANRLARSGASVRQILTSGNCHLEAHMISSHLAGWNLDLNGLDFLFIENVGNLVCPAEFDVGEHAKAMVYSVTEGEDKPLKYPVMFRSVDLVLLNKIDLVPYLDADVERYIAHVREVNPHATVLPVSARTGAGMADWFGWLRAFAGST